MGTVDGFNTVRIVSAGGGVAAEFVPDANMVCRSLTHDGAELLDAGRGVAAYAQRGKTMGVPLLYPWANRLAAPGYDAAGKRVTLPDPEGRYGLDPNGLPIHGALPGLMRWVLEERAAEDRVGARLEWTEPELLELFPFAHEVRLDAWVGDAGIQIVTTVLATGQDTVPVAFGFHPYLRPPGDEHRDAWRVSLGATERLILDDHLIPTGGHEPLDPTSFTLGDQSWDDGLAGLSSPPTFSVGAAAGTVTVTFDEGFSVAQVYAPPGHDYICFEPMTAPINALASGSGLSLVAPGDEYRTAFSITVSHN
jgi:aldose 1-epimerase